MPLELPSEGMCQLSPSISSSASRTKLGAVSVLKGRVSVLPQKVRFCDSLYELFTFPCSTMQLWVSRFAEGRLISSIKLSYTCCHCKWGREYHDVWWAPRRGWRCLSLGRKAPCHSIGMETIGCPREVKANNIFLSWHCVCGSNPQCYSVLRVVSKFQRLTHGGALYYLSLGRKTPSSSVGSADL